MAVLFPYLRGFLILFLSLFFVQLYGQNITNYVFSPTSGTYTSVSSGTQIFGGGVDDNVSSGIPIGFDFWYMGQRYTDVRVSANGWISFGNATDSAPTNNLSTGGTRPIVAPLWDDLAVFPGILATGIAPGDIGYSLAGSAGNRILTVQWNLMRWDKNSAVTILPATVMSFQAKLYENGNIQFIYSRDGGSVNNGSASVGITGASGVYLSLNGTGANPIARSDAETNNLSTRPATGQTYTFDPTELPAPSTLNFTRVGSTGMRVNWTDNSTGEIGFVIYRSTDGTNFTYLATTAANAIFYDDTGLTNATTYYYRVYTLRENLSLGFAAGNQLTGCSTFIVGTSPNPTGAGNNGPVCAGTAFTLSANAIDGALYAWTGPNGFMSSLQNPTLTYTDNAKGVYTVVISRNGCSATLTTTVTSTGNGQWTGNVSSDWLNGGNWCSGVVPTSLVNVSIPATGVANNPSLTGLGSANNLDVAVGRTLSISGNGNLQIAGAVTNSGAIAATAGKVTFNGTAAQSIPLNVFSTNVIKDLELNNAAGVNLNGTLRLTGVLTATAGIFNTGGFLTLASDQASTAQVAPIPASASVRGNVTVERYVQGGTVNPHRTYRMLSSPVYDNVPTFTITDTEGSRSAKFSQLIDDIIVSGNGGLTNGFDPTHNNYASSWTYNLGFIRVPDITTAVNAGRGMYFLFRGDRTNIPLKTYPPYPIAETVVMDFEGVLNQQNVTASLGYSAADGLNLLGNPYAATIDWDSPNWGADKGTASNATWTWNPAKRGYAAYVNGIGTLDGSRYISSGQAFFVQANATGTLRFKESIKAITQQPAILSMSMRANAESVMQVPRSIFRIGIKPINSYGEDETVIVFDQSSSISYTQEDASHMDGEVVNISSLADGQKLAINFLPFSSTAMEIGLNVSAAASGNYMMQFNLDEYHQTGVLKLKDNYLQRTTPITSAGVYNFSIDISNAQTLGAGRFSILVEPPTVLSVGPVSFTFKKQSEGVLLNWATESGSTTRLFKLYRAGDDGKYVPLGEFPVKVTTSYSFLDAVPLTGNNYYKLVQIDVDGTEVPGEPIVVNFVIGQSNAAVAFPNPVKDKLTIKVDGLTEEKYRVQLYGVTGQLFVNQQVSKLDLNGGHELELLRLTPGFYFVKVSKHLSRDIVTLLKIIKH